ncbi:MAG TPA: hypothetical protein PLM98_10955 [Thiolinea sp.]|nr:hypothetical protein [Thiolinea sp.]
MKKPKIIINFLSLIAIASTQLACSNNPSASLPPAQTQPPAPIQSPQTGTMPLGPASMLIKFKDMDASKPGIPAQRLAEINQILNPLGLNATFESDHFEGIKSVKIISRAGDDPSDETVQTAGKHLKAKLNYIDFAEANRRGIHHMHM